ncbi:MAG TPA: potassium/proton antiporter [Gaiellaceae bacterium]|nr:potassium/proton antiporter [Gaiellaceae bacterium]
MIDERILAAGGILLLAVAAAVLTRRLRFPLLITFLGLGMLLGSEGLGGIYFDNAHLARSIGVVGLIAILFEGGLTTDWRDVKPLLGPAFLLSTVGVLVTAGITAIAAQLVFDFSWTQALLLGSVVGSTDAAAVFATLRFTRLRRRLATVLAAESGANDPMAVALTLGFIAWITTRGYGGQDIAVLLLRQLGLGLVIGIGLGFIATRLLPRVPVELAPFAPVASIGIAAVAYGVPAVVDASGFLSVYVVALWLGNTPMPLRRTIASFHEGVAFLAQVVLFVVLGLLVFPSALGPVALSSLAVTAVLVLVARPLAVLISTAPFGFGLRGLAFLSWAGLRGAVPIVLATFALSEGVDGSSTIFNAVFFVVLVSTIVQGTTLEPLAHRLGLATEARHYYQPPVEVGAVRALGGDIVEYEVAQSDAIVGAHVRELGLPRTAIVMLIVRGESGLPPRGSTLVESGDRLYVLVRGESRAEVEALLELWERGPMPTPLRLASAD